ncbi:MAG: CRISPR-associated protein Cas2 [Candidatus Taylorbacteria bacterium]|nr:CRISPR-associated protein Cas2 [Candidatus Taylorbacteria bacterium]
MCYHIPMKSDQKYAIMTVGKTHSGKTTFARRLAKELPNFEILEADPIAAFLGNNFPKLKALDKLKTNEDIADPKLKFILFRDMIAYALKGGLNLVLCNGNLIERMRSDTAAMVRKHSYALIGVYFNYPESLLRERIAASDRSKDVLNLSRSFEEVLDRQNGVFQLPSPDEFDHFFEVKHPDELPAIEQKLIELMYQK